MSVYMVFLFRPFFRRGIGKPYCCVEGTGDCSIDWTNRRSCQWCRFDKCLRVGMNPQLVDAKLRKKSLNKKSAISDEPVLINNLEPLENVGVISNVLKVRIETHLNTLHSIFNFRTSVFNKMTNHPHS